MRENDHRLALLLCRLLDCAADGDVKRVQTGPRCGCFERIDEQMIIQQLVTQVR